MWHPLWRNESKLWVFRQSLDNYSNDHDDTDDDHNHSYNDTKFAGYDNNNDGDYDSNMTTMKMAMTIPPATKDDDGDDEKMITPITAIQERVIILNIYFLKIQCSYDRRKQ